MFFDPLAPFNNEDSRKENILVEFDNVLINNNYYLLRYLLDNFNIWNKLFPKIEELKDLDDEIHYNLGYLYPRLSFLSQLSNSHIEKENEVLFLLEKEIKYSNNNYLNRIGMIFFNLLSHSKINSISFFSDNLTQEKLFFLRSLYGDYCNDKILIYEFNSPKEAIIEMSESTTIFLENSERFLSYYKELDLKGKDFYFPINNYNCILSEITVMNKKENELKQISENHNCGFNLFYPHYEKF